MVSERLRYRPVDPAALDAFHALVRDAHVRRYLLDGTVFDRDWSLDRIRDSQDLSARRGVGFWLVSERETGVAVGFCGFLEIPDVHPEPQLVYALYERFTGRGYATEMARTAIAAARRQPGFAEVVADVDAVNAASVRVLEKLGFVRVSTVPGSLGDLYLYRLAGDAR